MDNPGEDVAPTVASPASRPRHRWMTAQLLVLLPTLGLALRVFGLRRLYAALETASASRVARGTKTAGTPGEAQRIAGVVMHVNRELLPFESRCLLESLALWWLLRRSGISADLVLGVRTIMGPFEAHAWVEHERAPLNDFAGVRGVYEPFDIGARRSARDATTPAQTTT